MSKKDKNSQETKKQSTKSKLTLSNTENLFEFDNNVSLNKERRHGFIGQKPGQDDQEHYKTVELKPRDQRTVLPEFNENAKTIDSKKESKEEKIKK